MASTATAESFIMSIIALIKISVKIAIEAFAGFSIRADFITGLIPYFIEGIIVFVDD